MILRPRRKAAGMEDDPISGHGLNTDSAREGASRFRPKIVTIRIHITLMKTIREKVEFKIQQQIVSSSCNSGNVGQ